MTFTRTASALYGIHRFFGVDLVVFCEGGASRSYSDAVKLEIGQSTLDTLYWSSLFGIINLDKSAHFKSIGSKSTINLICQDVERLGINTVTICRDSDYDRALGVAPQGARVAWSMGYSWESDVVAIEVVEALAFTLVGTGPDGTAIASQLRARFARLEADLRRWTEIDASLCKRGCGALFDRQKPLSSIDMSDPPSLRVLALTARLVEAGYNRKPRKVLTVSSGEALSTCFGKLVSRAIYQTFVRVIAQFVQVRIEYELFMRLAISETFRALDAGRLPRFQQHIGSQVHAFT
ncbi:MULTISPECIES: hypothetical protein [unclassified Novosphingobium]|uniref:hypothetical protein n=1 Tax=unclassified Novosphingobium TaxID=2644732 RepID=UPI000D3F9469|nr:MULTISPECIES: hypothetical protein [unclassified Novosphingobium]PTR07588.1 hypothetical protein C8K11_11566 [Novosphingobium sp. GV055]PUB00290.1 hypothetical protein C8K12_11566 [Novosphingobium sp. GV061]PUB15331.1 hypothetical protein C8K14_11566 [Novosphingobium sp. GV079]PUB39207.1 hypothetical protein C8K10_11566 [Novosphingobium sp. GV027]